MQNFRTHFLILKVVELVGKPMLHWTVGLGLQHLENLAYSIVSEPDEQQKLETWILALRLR